jgi:hypothetical protein
MATGNLTSANAPAGLNHKLRRDEEVQDRDGGRDNQDRAGDLPEAAVCLLANALEVAPPASQITLTGGRSRDLVELHVIDQGPA